MTGLTSIRDFDGSFNFFDKEILKKVVFLRLREGEKSSSQSLWMDFPAGNQPENSTFKWFNVLWGMDSELGGADTNGSGSKGSKEYFVRIGKDSSKNQVRFELVQNQAETDS